MRIHRKFRITITDESRLQDVFSRTLSPRGIWLIALAVFLFTLALGYLFVLITPLKTLIPGYFHESQRAASIEAMLRVDSISEAYKRNEAWIANMRTVMDINRTKSDSMVSSCALKTFSPDSLLPQSQEEARFVKMMQEREKFNISVVASMAAEGMLFFPASDEGVPALESRESYISRISLPSGASVMAIADGSVLAQYYDYKSRGYSILMQHENGFVSRYSGLGNPLVGQGDIVSGGEVICLAPRPAAGKPIEISVELWHNGSPVKPYDYLFTGRPHPIAEPSSHDSSYGDEFQ